MVITAGLQGQFLRAAYGRGQRNDALTTKVQEEVFCHTLKPVHHILKTDPAYKSLEIDICQQIEELRNMCGEAQARHTTDDFLLKLGRSDLLNRLQSIKESLEASNNGVAEIYNDDLFALPNLTNVIRGDAAIYREYMKSPAVADALDEVADNIDVAQSRLWNLGKTNAYSIGSEAANEDSYYGNEHGVLGIHDIEGEAANSEELESRDIA